MSMPRLFGNLKGILHPPNMFRNTVQLTRCCPYDVNGVRAEYKSNGVNSKALYDHVMIILCHSFQGHYLIDGDALSAFKTRLPGLIGACIHEGVTVFNIA